MFRFPVCHPQCTDTYPCLSFSHLVFAYKLLVHAHNLQDIARLCITEEFHPLIIISHLNREPVAWLYLYNDYINQNASNDVPFPVRFVFLFSTGIDLRRMGSPVKPGSVPLEVSSSYSTSIFTSIAKSARTVRIFKLQGMDCHGMSLETSTTHAEMSGMWD